MAARWLVVVCARNAQPHCGYGFSEPELASWLLPWHRQTGPVVVFTPADQPCTLPGCEQVVIGHSGHTGVASIERMLGHMDYLLGRADWDWALLNDFDSASFAPLAGFPKPGLYANVHRCDPKPPYTQTWYPHNPLAVDRDTLARLREAARRIPVDAEGATGDRWLARVATEAGIEPIPWGVAGYARNPITPEDRVDCLDAVHRGARQIHGIKDPELLGLIVRGLETGVGVGHKDSALSSYGALQVYTYWEFVPEVYSPELGQRYLTLWKRAWECCGWNANVLTRCDYERELDWPAHEAAIRQFPSVNALEYHRANLRRWLALRNVGGGLMVDYDVLPLPNAQPAWWSCERFAPILIGTTCGVPCFVHATRDGAGVITDTIRQYRGANRLACGAAISEDAGVAFGPGSDLADGRPHISDMTIFRARALGLQITLCDNYRPAWADGEVPWAKAPRNLRAIHYSYEATTGAGRERLRLMEAHVAALEKGIAQCPQPSL